MRCSAVVADFLRCGAVCGQNIGGAGAVQYKCARDVSNQVNQVLFCMLPLETFIAIL